MICKSMQIIVFILISISLVYFYLCLHVFVHFSLSYFSTSNKSDFYGFGMLTIITLLYIYNIINK